MTMNTPILATISHRAPRCNALLPADVPVPAPAGRQHNDVAYAAHRAATRNTGTSIWTMNWSTGWRPSTQLAKENRPKNSRLTNENTYAKTRKLSGQGTASNTSGRPLRICMNIKNTLTCDWSSALAASCDRRIR